MLNERVLLLSVVNLQCGCKGQNTSEGDEKPMMHVMVAVGAL